MKTRMTTFIKTKFNKSDDQTNIDNIDFLCEKSVRERGEITIAKFCLHADAN